MGEARRRASDAQVQRALDLASEIVDRLRDELDGDPIGCMFSIGLAVRIIHASNDAQTRERIEGRVRDLLSVLYEQGADPNLRDIRPGQALNILVHRRPGDEGDPP